MMLTMAGAQTFAVYQRTDETETWTVVLDAIPVCLTRSIATGMRTQAQCAELGADHVGRTPTNTEILTKMRLKRESDSEEWQVVAVIHETAPVRHTKLLLVEDSAVCA
jgi:hypothetical protein